VPKHKKKIGQGAKNLCKFTEGPKMLLRGGKGKKGKAGRLGGNPRHKRTRRVKRGRKKKERGYGCAPAQNWA